MKRILSLVLTTLALAIWFVAFRPAALGGPVSYVVVSGTSMQPTLHTGDLVVVRHRDTYAKGQVIAYAVPDGIPGAGKLVIHRITGGDARHGFTTQGDNRAEADDWHPRDQHVKGALWIHVPGAGRWIATVREPAVFASLAAGFTVFSILLGPGRRRRPTDSADADDTVDRPSADHDATDETHVRVGSA
jgi:signal peptidase